MEEKSWGWIGALAVAVVWLIREGVAEFLKIRKSNSDQEKSAIDYYRQIIDGLKADAARVEQQVMVRGDLYEKQMRDANARIEALISRSHDCDADYRILWGILEQKQEESQEHYQFAVSLHEALSRLGHEVPIKPRPPSPLPPRQETFPRRASVELQQRNAEQAATSLQDLGNRLHDISEAHGAPK